MFVRKFIPTNFTVFVLLCSFFRFEMCRVNHDCILHSNFLRCDFDFFFVRLMYLTMHRFNRCYLACDL